MEPFSLKNTLNQALENSWKEILGMSEIDPDLSFLDLGGNSLLANQFVARFETTYGVSIPVTQIFEFPTLRQLQAYLNSNAGDIGSETISIKESKPKERAYFDRDIAIIGMSVRVPGAESLEDFWTNLRQGKDTIRHLTNDQINPEIPHTIRNDPNYVPACGTIAEPFAMDAALFDISPMEAKIMDPQQRILLEASWEALEHAGHGPGSFDGETGVFVGVYDNSYYKEEVQKYPAAVKRAGYLSVSTGNEKDFVALRIAHKLNLKGPAISVATACSTSLVAVIMAANSLRNQECDIAIAGGAAVHFPTEAGYLFQEEGIFSPDGRCRPFDQNAQGTVFTDGVGVVVLKRLSDAIRDRNTIHAIIKGGAINNDGNDKASFSAPSVTGQTACILKALADADIPSESIQYVETHGTGTLVGDPIEFDALRRAYGKNTDKKHFCGMSSVKSNIGHTTIAAGVIGLIKTVLSIQHRQMPATVHFTSPNPQLKLEHSPFFIVDRLMDWPTTTSPRRASVSSFGLGGTNAHLILEEWSPVDSVYENDNNSDTNRPFEIFPVSAKSAIQRDMQLQSLESFEALNRDTAFSLQNGRSRLKFRGARIRFQSYPSADILVHHDQVTLDSNNDRPMIFMFPGQGSQYIGMGRGLFEYYPEFRTHFLECCSILDREIGFDFKSFLFNDNNHENKTKLENTQFTQPALFAIEYSIGKMLMDWGLIPDTMIGHSVGEFAAATLAGVFTLENGLKLVAKRGQVMAAIPQGKMLSVRAAIADIHSIVGDKVDVASVNSPFQCVLSGTTDAIIEAESALNTKHIQCKILHTSHAFHSRMMDPAIEPFYKLASTIELMPPRLKIISTVTGKSLTDSEATNPHYWSQHLRSPVLFSNAIESAINAGGGMFLEVGPRSTLTSLTSQQLKPDACQAFSFLADSAVETSEINTFATTLAKIWVHSRRELSWNQIWKGGKRIPLPAYPFERRTFRFSDLQNETKAIIMNQKNISDSLFTAVRKLLEEFSGMSIVDPNKTFVESGFDSLVLVQVGVELSKIYGLSISLKHLMQDVNSLNLLTAYIRKNSEIKTELVNLNAAPVENVLVKEFVDDIGLLSADVVQIIGEQLEKSKKLLELQQKILAAHRNSFKGEQVKVTPLTLFKYANYKDLNS